MHKHIMQIIWDENTIRIISDRKSSCDQGGIQKTAKNPAVVFLQRQAKLHLHRPFKRLQILVAYAPDAVLQPLLVNSCNLVGHSLVIGTIQSDKRLTGVTSADIAGKGDDLNTL
jgi:hypothetical protein